ncbi:MAG TPA: ABC transporter permease, partial [Magnetospirillaceae bacterium]|nr:ABC transporter permease [Magnetospirillaceae bacterium]
QIGFDYLAGFGLLGLLAGLIALVPALPGGEALAGFVLRLLNFNSLSHAPAWLILALPAGSAAFAALIAQIRLRPALALPVRDALSRADLAQGSRLADLLQPLLGHLPPLPRMAAWTLARKPWRTLLTAVILSLGLTFFMTALTLRGSMLQTLEVTRRTNAFDVAVMMRGETPRASLDEWLKGVPGIAQAEYWSSSNAMLADKQAPLLRVPADAQAVHPDLLAGSWLSAERPNDIVVNQAMLKLIPELHIGSTYTLDGEEVRLAGVVREFWGGRVYALKRQRDSANLVLISLPDHSFQAQRAMLPKLEGPGVATVVPAKLMEAIILGHLDPLTLLLGILAGLALLVGGLGLGSAIAVGIVERFREIGVMKAVGARGCAVFLLIMAEGVFVSLLGWLIAAAVAPMVSRPIVEIFGSLVVGYPFEYRTGLAGPLGALAAALAAALIASLPPTRAALRASVRAALRSE